MNKHIIIATYDGIGTHYSGVGTIAKNLVFALSKLSGKYNFKVSIAYINVDKSSKVFNRECFQESLDLVKDTGGQIIPLCNTTKGESEWDMWRSFEEWDFTCVSLVTSLNIILNDDEENILILNDTPFLMFAKYKDLVFKKNLKCFYFPLSTGLNHAFGRDAWRNKRIGIEKDCFALIKDDPDSKVISLGKNFAKSMNNDYGLDFNQNDYLQNGLCFEKYHDYLNKKFHNSDLKKYNIHIPDGKKIIFSWGRCSIAKGFKELSSAWVKAYKSLPNHYLILQIPNNSGEADYFMEIKEMLKDIPRAIIIDNFNPDIWKTVLRTDSTDVVCIPSLFDPFPHTSIEAKLFSVNMNFITLISNVDGAVDAFEENESIYVDPRDVDDFVGKIIGVVKMDTNKRREIIKKSEDSIDKFNFPKILEKFMRLNLIIS